MTLFLRTPRHQTFSRVRARPGQRETQTWHCWQNILDAVILRLVVSHRGVGGDEHQAGARAEVRREQLAVRAELAQTGGHEQRNVRAAAVTAVVHLCAVAAGPDVARQTPGNAPAEPRRSRIGRGRRPCRDRSESARSPARTRDRWRGRTWPSASWRRRCSGGRGLVKPTSPNPSSRAYRRMSSVRSSPGLGVPVGSTSAEWSAASYIGFIRTSWTSRKSVMSWGCVTSAHWRSAEWSIAWLSSGYSRL